MFKFLKWFFRKRPDAPQKVLIHNSYFRGWPRAPTIHLKYFPLVINVSRSPVPTSLPFDVVSYTFFDYDDVLGLQRATYLLDIEHSHKNVPGFVWVFLIN